MRLPVLVGRAAASSRSRGFTAAGAAVVFVLFKGFPSPANRQASSVLVGFARDETSGGQALAARGNAADDSQGGVWQVLDMGTREQNYNLSRRLPPRKRQRGLEPRVQFIRLGRENREFSVRLALSAQFFAVPGAAILACCEATSVTSASTFAPMRPNSAAASLISAAAARIGSWLRAAAIVASS
jgi:hypothetical protein